MQGEDIYNVIGPERKRQETSLPFKCPQCHEGFRNDIALLRHQRKMDHFNQERVDRRNKKKLAAKGKGRQRQADGSFICRYCKERLSSKKERCSHYNKCGQKPQQEEEMSQLDPDDFLGYYQGVSFENSSKTDSQELQSDHSSRKKRMYITQGLRLKMFREFSKYAHLKQQTIDRFSCSWNLSRTSIRRHFQIFKYFKIDK